MNSPIAVFVKRPIFTWVLVLCVTVAGLASLRGLGLERYPNVDVPVVTVITLAPGLSATQVETEITARIENAVGTVAGLERSDSTSLEGASMVSAQFVLEKDGAVAAQDVRDRVARLASELPDAASPPQIELFNPNASPIMLLSVTGSGTRTAREVTAFAETVVKRELQTIKGVGDVRLSGGERRAFWLDLDEGRLASFNITAGEIKEILLRQEMDAAGGELAQGEVGLQLRVSARARNREELGEVIVAQRGTMAVRLSDVAEIQDGSETAASTAVVSGQPAVVLGIIKQSGANTLAVLDEVRRRISDLSVDRVPAGIEIRVVRDEGIFVEASLNAVEEHLLLGALLAAAVVLLFLRSPRATLIAGLAIPASVVGTFAALKALNLSLNMLTLLGLTLAVGIVIDDAIVVLENVVRVIRSKKLPPAQAAVEATREIGLAVLATTLSLVAVFLPVAFMGGVVGRFLASFGLTMSVSILLSMAVAFTLTPMLCARWLRPAEAEPGHHGVANTPPPAQLGSEAEIYRAWGRGERAGVEEKLGEHAHDGVLERSYGRVLSWVMRRRWVVGLAMLAALLGTVPLGALLPKTFVPIEDEGRFEVYLRLPDGTLLEQTTLTAERVARAVRDLPDVKETVVLAGAPRGDASGRGPNEASIYVALKRTGIQQATMNHVRENVLKDKLPKHSLALVNAIGDFGGTGVDATTVQYVLRGPDLAVLEQIAGKLLIEAKKIPGTTDHGSTVRTGTPELALRVDVARTAELGLSNSDVAELIQIVGRQGVEVGYMRDPLDEGDSSYPTLLHLRDEPLATELRLRHAAIRSPQGRAIELHEFAQVEPRQGPSEIRRANRQRQATLFMNTAPGVSDEAVLESLHAAATRIGLPSGYGAEIMGNAREMEKTEEAFVTASVLSLVFMYLVLAAQFESWIHPITILISLPLTVPFALFSLLIFGQSLNLFSGLGFLVLFGIVKKNSILQVDHMIALRAQGLTRADAVIVANKHRLRPILMTTVAFVAGMVPLVVTTGPGAATNRAIAVGVMGGQTLALLLTLLATPVVYTWLDDIQERWKPLLQRLPRVPSLRWKQSRGSFIHTPLANPRQEAYRADSPSRPSVQIP